jgi:hypothetical protein
VLVVVWCDLLVRFEHGIQHVFELELNWREVVDPANDHP